jgi:hypothetical protein
MDRDHHLFSVLRLRAYESAAIATDETTATPGMLAAQQNAQ